MMNEMSLLVWALATLAVSAIAFIWRWLYPTPYPGIPYNVESAKRIAGDLPDLLPMIQATHEFSESFLAVSTRKLGTPMAQILFPGLLRKPMIVLDDPREVEDLVVRRSKEFDKSPLVVDLFAPMFPGGTTGQYTTPELKAQKRLWADVMQGEFLARVAGPSIRRAVLDLVELWRLKGSTMYKDQPFEVLGDFRNAALDAIWVALIGQELGVTKFEIQKLQGQLEGKHIDDDKAAAAAAAAPPRGTVLEAEMEYLAGAIGRGFSSPLPKWTQRLETWTPRYRRFRKTVSTEIRMAMEQAAARFQRLQAGKLENDDHDTCMMDLVLRRQILAARKAGRDPPDPTEDSQLLDEMFVLLFGGRDSTANAMAWFLKFIERYPLVQAELREALKAAFRGPNPPSAEEIIRTDVPYLDATCEEAFRLAGASKASVRQALVDTELLGYRIPKGAEVFFNLHIDRAPALVGDESRRSASSQSAAQKRGGDGFAGAAGRDLSVFEPRRWLVRDETTGKETFNPYAIPSLAFSGGYRGCFGRKLATMEFRIMVVLVILHFEFLELPEELRAMGAVEEIFRCPTKPHARIRLL